MTDTQRLPSWLTLTRVVRIDQSGSTHLQGSRPETGPMKFGEDWTGVFIRGDDALIYASALEHYCKRNREISGVGLDPPGSMVHGMLELLRSCSEGNTGWPPQVADRTP